MAAINKRVAFRRLINQRKLLTFVLLRLRMRLKKKSLKYKKSLWIRKIFEEREEKSEYRVLVRELELYDKEYFFKMFRMSPQKFEHLLSWVAPSIMKSSLRRSVASPAERLCVTLRYLSTGDAQITLAACYRISPAVVGRVIKETTEAIWNNLKERKFIDPPTHPGSWLEIANEFDSKWNFPHCLGAIDGKHVVIQAPPRCGSLYFNYKKTHSIVLLAVCNANYEITLADVGDNGRQSDGGVYTNSKIGYAIDNNLLQIPPPGIIANSGKTKEYPYVFVADDAFSLKTYMIKPYPGNITKISEQIYKYRLCRARRVIENTFGILATRFRIYRRPIIANVDMVKNVVKATIAFLNFLLISQRTEDSYIYCPQNFVDQNGRRGRVIPGQWRQEIGATAGFSKLDRHARGSNNSSKSAQKVRDDYKEYFNSPEGAVTWQVDAVTSTTDPFDPRKLY